MILRLFNVEKKVTDPEKIRRMKSEGWYVVYDESLEMPVVPEKVVIDYEKLTKKELVEMAEASGIKGAKSMTKAVLIEALKERR